MNDSALRKILWAAIALSLLTAFMLLFVFMYGNEAVFNRGITFIYGRQVDIGRLIQLMGALVPLLLCLVVTAMISRLLAAMHKEKAALILRIRELEKQVARLNGARPDTMTVQDDEPPGEGSPWSFTWGGK
jgi:magnesium-transporting ATPase (P-type)